MAILTSVDGKVYEIPDDELSRFELSEELLAQIGAAADETPDVGPSAQDRDAAAEGAPADTSGDGRPDDGPG